MGLSFLVSFLLCHFSWKFILIFLLRLFGHFISFAFQEISESKTCIENQTRDSLEDLELISCLNPWFESYNHFNPVSSCPNKNSDRTGYLQRQSDFEKYLAFQSYTNNGISFLVFHICIYLFVIHFCFH